ncbi:YxeA family protein [Enterococcus wangshanyuanii]|nr:YxeA family protein [Enterococcus wangshanyuanii]
MIMAKKFIKKTVSIAALLLVSAFCFRLYTHNNTSDAAAFIDRLNPLVQTETLYVRTTDRYAYKFPDSVSKIDNYTYIQTCFDKNGQTRKLAYTSFGRPLTPKRFLKVTTKGQSIQHWEEIDEQEIPRKIISLL